MLKWSYNLPFVTPANSRGKMLILDHVQQKGLFSNNALVFFPCILPSLLSLVPSSPKCPQPPSFPAGGQSVSHQRLFKLFATIATSLENNTVTYVQMPACAQTKSSTYIYTSLHPARLETCKQALI